MKNNVAIAAVVAGVLGLAGVGAGYAIPMMTYENKIEICVNAKMESFTTAFKVKPDWYINELNKLSVKFDSSTEAAEALHTYKKAVFTSECIVSLNKCD